MSECDYGSPRGTVISRFSAIAALLTFNQSVYCLISDLIEQRE